MCNCSAKQHSVAALFVGVVLIVVAIVLPPIIDTVLSKKICDTLCIPNTSDEVWKINNWLSNRNESAHPPEYYRFYLYNLTNPEMVMSGAKPIVAEVGPYAYRFWRQFFNIERFVNNNAQIGYELQTMFEFDKELTKPGLSESDIFTNVNLPFVGGLAFTYWAQGCVLPNLLTNCNAPPTGRFDQQMCLFSPMTASEMLFSQKQSLIVEIANLFIYQQPRLDSNFRVFINAATEEEAHQVNTVGHWYGLGGKYDPTILPVTFPTKQTQFNAPGINNNNTRTIQHTGQDDVANLGKISGFMGNTSIAGLWNGVEEVRGGDAYNFPPGVTSESQLSIWNDLLLRNVPLVYLNDASIQGIDTLLFRSSPALWAGQDPHYNYEGTPIPRGVLNISMMPNIRYGTPCSQFVSSPHFYNADPIVSNTVTCVNCPEPKDQILLDHISHMYVEPITGAVVSGAMMGQVNTLIGTPALFNGSCAAGTPLAYTNMHPSYLPYVWFKYSADITSDLADSLMKPNLRQAKLALAVRSVSLYGGAIVGGLLMLLAVYLYMVKAPRDTAAAEQSGQVNVAEGAYYPIAATARSLDRK